MCVCVCVCVCVCACVCVCVRKEAGSVWSAHVCVCVCESAFSGGWMGGGDLHIVCVLECVREYYLWFCASVSVCEDKQAHTHTHMHTHVHTVNQKINE